MTFNQLIVERNSGWSACYLVCGVSLCMRYRQWGEEQIILWMDKTWEYRIRGIRNISYLWFSQLSIHVRVWVRRAVFLLLSRAENLTPRGCAYIPRLTTAQLVRMCMGVCVCVRVCVQERESPLHSTLLSFSLPSLAPFLLPALWLLSPSLLYTFFLSSLLYVPLPPSLPVLRLYPLLSLSLAVHHFWRWMSQRLKLRRLCPWLAAIHKLVIKRKGREEEQGRKAEGG